MNLTSFTSKHNRKMQTFDTNKIKKFNNIDSSNVSEFTSKSMDVIVDIHREYKDEKQVEDIQQNRKSDKTSTNIFSNNSQLFLKTNKKNKKSNINLVTHESFEEHNDINVVDTLDLIEEFQEPLVNKKDEQTVELIKENINQSLIEEKSVHKKQWVTIKNTVEELKKPPRKRWSKDNSLIQLPEAKNVSWNKTKRSLPAIKQSSLIQKSVTAYDNKAFLSENEEILRIETDYSQEDTKIEIKETADQLENAVLSMVDNRSSQDSNMRKISNESVVISDDLNRSINNIVVDNSNSSQSLEENYSFEEISTKNNQLWNKGKSKRNSRQHSVSASKDDDIRHSSQLDEEHLRNSSECTISTTEDDEDQLTEVRYESKLKSDSRRKKLKHLKHHSRSQNRKNKKEVVNENVSSSTIHTPSIHIEENKKKKKKKKKIDAKYISIMIHRADMLVIDYVTKHPMVKVHIVNAENGKYFKREHGAGTYLQPMITGKFDFKENKTIIPVWEEELIFEHDFKALLEIDSEQVVILFEIVDLLSFTEASFNYDKFGHEGCWYKVAWGFLKPVGRNNVLHIEKKIRLQLYKPQKSLRRFDSAYTCEVYTWWKSNIREKYPSSLFITVTSIDPPKLESVYYQQLTLHDSSKTSTETQKTSIRASDLINLPKWTRLAAQSCKIPNETIFKTDTSENGCFYVAFSNDGKYLACSFSEEYDYPIIVYEVETKKIHVRFSGHKTLIYSLHWSNDDTYLLSVSSDQTACIWDVRNQIVQYVEMMPHPLYVYCGKFDPEDSSIVATGCYDQIARIWIRDKRSKKRDLSQELEGHGGFVNCMCFQKNSNLLTADSVGIIIIWTVKKNRKVPFKKEWHISRKIRVRDIDGVIINTIVLHPLESRLLVHSRNNGLRMLDLATGVVLQKYNELNNQRIQSTACISPCGSLILCGGEDSSLKVWNLETGNLLAKYTFDRNCRAVTCVDYHPYDHVLAYSTFGNSAPVRVLRFNKDATGEDVDLKIFEGTENAVNSHDIPIRFLNSSVRSRDKPQSNDTEQTPENISKGSLQSSRSYNSSHYKSPNDVSDNYNNTRIRLQRLSEVGQTLKSKSASRLYNIIEKIDRILSNTSRSPGDIESGWNLALIQETSTNTILTSQNENEEKDRIKSKKDKLAFLNNEIQSNSFAESSTINSDRQEVVELRTLENWSIKRRSKSAKEIRNKDVPRDNVAKTLSDSATHHPKSKFNRKIMKTTPDENSESIFVIKTKEHNSKSIVYHKNEDDDSSSSCSTGTYVVDKESTKILEYRNSILSDTENELNIVECSESDYSVPSNATFIIENEIPIPKPRKKIGLK